MLEIGGGGLIESRGFRYLRHRPHRRQSPHNPKRQLCDRTRADTSKTPSKHNARDARSTFRHIGFVSDLNLGDFIHLLPPNAFGATQLAPCLVGLVNLWQVIIL